MLLRIILPLKILQCGDKYHKMLMSVKCGKAGWMKSLNTLRLALAFCLLLAAPGQAQENPPGPGLQWHWGMPRFGGADLMAVAHGAGVWVAVGEGGTILVSRDAVIWTRQP